MRQGTGTRTGTEETTGKPGGDVPDGEDGEQGPRQNSEKIPLMSGDREETQASGLVAFKEYEHNADCEAVGFSTVDVTSRKAKRA